MGSHLGARTRKRTTRTCGPIRPAPSRINTAGCQAKGTEGQSTPPTTTVVIRSGLGSTQHATVFTKNRDRLLEAEVAKLFLASATAQPLICETLLGNSRAMEALTPGASVCLRGTNFDRPGSSNARRTATESHPYIDFYRSRIARSYQYRSCPVELRRQCRQVKHANKY